MFSPLAIYAKQATAAAGPQLWTPANNPNLLAWYDASDTGTITVVSGKVSQWNDKSGNGFNASQATAGNRPFYGTYQLNSADVITFGASNISLQMTAVNYTNRDVSLYTIGRMRDRNNYAVAILFAKGVGSDAVTQLYESVETQWGYYGDVFNPSNTVLINNVWGNFGLIGDNATTSAAYFLNGSADGTVSGGNFGTTSVFSNGISYIGNDMYTSYLQGDMAEIVLINAKDSTADREKMEGYLAWNWGLEGDLPPGHPYKSAPPTV